jgi:tRNA A-37 threonylcarbamoyl transferase component Bud32
MKCSSCGVDNVEGARFCAGCGASVGEPAAAENTLVGQIVGGRYHVKRVLGEGGMGIVYEAEQQMGSAVRKVALKTLHQHLSRDPSVTARFHRECGTIAGLEHPNTIKVYDFGATADGTLYIAMEFVAGLSLSQVLEKAGGALPPERALKIMRQIAGSLEEAHQQGIIHRDLKPDNVVLTDRAGEKDVVKLLDFGIAARTESADAQREQKLTQQGMVLGTPPYMSPEQFTGKALDPRSDVYSLGVMAYEMLTGRLPFDAQTPWQWATEHMTAKPIPFEATPVSAQIPEAMRAAVLRSLSKNRDERQTSAKQFYDELAGDAAVPHAAAAPGASTGTAAMAAPPGFGNQAIGSARTAAMPTTGAAASVVAPVVPGFAPPKGGGKGLLIGLAGVGGVLLIGIVIVATRSMKPSEPVAVEAPPAAATPPPATIAPQAAPPEPATPPTPSSRPVEEAVLPPVAPTTPKQTASTGGPAKPALPADPCARCLSAAASRNFGAASSAYGSCTDAAQKAKCGDIIKSGTPEAAKSAAFNGNCAQAKAAMAAGQSLGAPARLFADVIKTCK